MIELFFKYKKLSKIYEKLSRFLCLPVFNSRLRLLLKVIYSLESSFLVLCRSKESTSKGNFIVAFKNLDISIAFKVYFTFMSQPFFIILAYYFYEISDTFFSIYLVFLRSVVFFFIFLLLGWEKYLVMFLSLSVCIL